MSKHDLQTFVICSQSSLENSPRKITSSSSSVSSAELRLSLSNPVEKKSDSWTGKAASQRSSGDGYLGEPIEEGNDGHDTELGGADGENVKYGSKLADVFDLANDARISAKDSKTSIAEDLTGSTSTPALAFGKEETDGTGSITTSALVLAAEVDGTGSLTASEQRRGSEISVNAKFLVHTFGNTSPFEVFTNSIDNSTDKERFSSKLMLTEPAISNNDLRGKTIKNEKTSEHNLSCKKNCSTSKT